MTADTGPTPGDTAAVGSALTGVGILGGGGTALAEAGVIAAEATNPIGWALLGGTALYFGLKAYQHAQQQADEQAAPTPPAAVCNCPADPAAPPETPPTNRPYSNVPDSPNVGPGKKFTQEQKKEFMQENRNRNGGDLRADDNGEPLVPSSKSTSGVTPPANEAQVDHIDPRQPSNPQAEPGSNSSTNAQIISR